MRSFRIGSLVAFFACLIALSLVAVSAPVVTAAEEQTPTLAPPRPVKPAVADEEPEPETTDDLVPTTDELTPIPDEAMPAATEESSAADDSAAEKDDVPATDAEPAADEAEGSTTEDEATEETLPPPPPRGTLLDKIREASTAAEPPAPLALNGIRAGISTAAELKEAWGTPLEISRQKEVIRQIFRLDGLGRVEVQCYHDVVHTMTVHYDQQLRWEELLKQMSKDKSDAVDVTNEFGDIVGAALPETGAIFVFVAEGSRRVARVVYGAVDPQAFTLRAEQRLNKDFTGCQKDLDQALVIDPQCAKAHWLRARALRAVGQLDSATKAAEVALRIEPKNPQYRLTYSAMLAASGQFAKAITETKETLAQNKLQPELRSYALNQLGDQLAAGPDRDFKQALPLHMQAIKLAEPLAQDRRPVVREMAHEVLIAAHLSAARNIAWGNWKMKKKMVPAWLNRAEELADDESDNEEAATDLRLRVCREALAACVGMEGDLDATPWIEKALTLGRPAVESATDPARQRQLQWELGSMLYDALQVYHTSGDANQAMKYGTFAVEYLEAGSEDRQLEPVEAYLLGRLYYRMGSVCTMLSKAPDETVSWFERAIPLLERPLPSVAQGDSGRHGEAFVSMAVSYWSVGSQEEAMRLTRHGMKLMEQAVKDGTLDEDALRVPYANLATMHRFLGDDEQADAFGEMATKVSTTRRQ